MGPASDPGEGSRNVSAARIRPNRQRDPFSDAIVHRFGTSISAPLRRAITRRLSEQKFDDIEFGKLTAAATWLSCWFVGRRLVREGRPDWKSMEFEMRELAELQKDVDFLKMLFNQRGSTHRYLEEVFRIRNKWEKRTTFAEFVELTTQIHSKPFDQRITRSRFRVLIKLTCGAQPTRKSEYSKALNNARKAGCKPSNLSKFFKRKGGIRNAAYG